MFSINKYKISIILPVYNGENHLRETLDSIVNQSLGIENIQVIIVNDCSTDKTKEIIDEYSATYPSFKPIHLKENSGAPYTPRNIALNYVESDYIMFIDADDQYTETSCEILYTTITSYRCDVAFGRYLRNYPEENIIRKSYTPFKDTLAKPYSDYKDDLVEGSNFKGIIGSLWKNIISYFIYGSLINLDNNNEIFIKDIKEEKPSEIAILKILPSFWTKIYRSDLILKNDIKFPEVISGEDLNFLLEVYLKSERGILFLNNQVVYDYYMRFEEEDKSVTKNINFKLVYESLKAYRLSSELADQHNLKNKHLFLNPYLLNWINLWLSRENTKDENKLYKEEIKLMKKGFKNNIIYKILLNLINLLLKIKS